MKDIIVKGMKRESAVSVEQGREDYTFRSGDKWLSLSIFWNGDRAVSGYGLYREGVTTIRLVDVGGEDELELAVEWDGEGAVVVDGTVAFANVLNDAVSVVNQINVQTM